MSLFTNRFAGWIAFAGAVVASTTVLLGLSLIPGTVKPLKPSDRARIEALFPHATVNKGDVGGYDVTCWEKDGQISGLLFCTRFKSAEQSAPAAQAHPSGVPLIP